MTDFVYVRPQMGYICPKCGYWMQQARDGFKIVVWCEPGLPTPNECPLAGVRYSHPLSWVKVEVEL